MVDIGTISMNRHQAVFEELDKFITRHGAPILGEFCEFLSIPNHASSVPDAERNAAFIKKMFENRGVATEVLRRTGAPPFVYGEYTVPSAERTLVLYAHYDGQPADATKWQSDPFSPLLRTNTIERGGQLRPIPQGDEEIDPCWRLYARSASDDKAPFVAMVAALDFLRQNNLPLTSNLKFIFEGEEEAGSRHLPEYLGRIRERLQGDVLLICDGPIHQSGLPQLYFGVRGFVAMDITLYGANRHLHSGHYGNWAPNPSLLLAHLLASMKDREGKVTIEGFYDGIEPLSEKERTLIGELPDPSAELKKELAIAQAEGEGNLTERLLLPSLNIRGLDGGAVGTGAQNVIPPTATVSIDMRLVRGNDPNHMLDLVENHIRQQGFHIVRVDPDQQTRMRYARIAKVIRYEGYPAVRTAMDSPIAQFIIDAGRQVTGGEIILLPSLGASLPLYQFDRHLGIPIVGVPIANHDSNQHGPDENIRIGNLWYGIKLFASIFGRM